MGAASATWTIAEDGRSSRRFSPKSRESTWRPFAVSGEQEVQAGHQFRESLKELERDTLGGLDMAAQQLDRALEWVEEPGCRAGRDGHRRRRPDRPALPADTQGCGVAARVPGAGRGRSADRRSAAAHHPLRRADGRPVRERRQTRAAVGSLGTPWTTTSSTRSNEWVSSHAHRCRKPKRRSPRGTSPSRGNSWASTGRSIA